MRRGEGERERWDGKWKRNKWETLQWSLWVLNTICTSNQII